MNSPIFVGVIASLIGAALIWLWTGILQPYLMRIYRGEPKLEKRWMTTFQEDGREMHESVSLMQIGLNVRGTIKLTDTNGRYTTYRFRGTFRHRILAATYDSTEIGRAHV